MLWQWISRQKRDGKMKLPFTIEVELEEEGVNSAFSHFSGNFRPCIGMQQPSILNSCVTSCCLN